MYCTSICGKLSRLRYILYKLSSMDKYQGIIKEIPLLFCVKCENFEFSTHFEKIVSSLFIKIQTSVMHQTEGNFIYYNPVLMLETLKLISKEC